MCLKINTMFQAKDFKTEKHFNEWKEGRERVTWCYRRQQTGKPQTHAHAYKHTYNSLRKFNSFSPAISLAGIH